MSADELRDEVVEQLNDVEFIYNGKPSGISPEFHNSIPVYYIWYGNEDKEHSDIDEAMSDKFFGGKSLSEISEIVKYT